MKTIKSFPLQNLPKNSQGFENCVERTDRNFLLIYSYFILWNRKQYNNDFETSQIIFLQL